MLHEVAIEALRYFDHKSLEGLQMHSRYLRDIVNRHLRTLPLRKIEKITVDGGRVGMDVLRHFSVNVPASSEEELQTFFHYVNNAFIRVLEFSFCREDLAALNYLRAKAGELQCQIRSLHISRTSTAGINYALVDFLGVHLKPQVYHFSTYGSTRFEEYAAKLFARNSLRDCVAHLEYELFDDRAPECILPELFGVDVVETCTVTTEVDPRPWIGKFIQTFEKAVRGTKIVPSVTLLHRRRGEASPLRQTGEPLGIPRRTDVPTPHCAFIKKWCRTQQLTYEAKATESTVADLFVFENAKSGKKLEVSVWTVERVDQFARNELHYAFFLEVVDM